MKITMKWLEENNACMESREMWQTEKMKSIDSIRLVKKLMVEDRFQWANWLIVRLMTHEQKIQYTIFAAEQVIEIYEKKYPSDNRPRKAIEAARKYIAEPSEENKIAAYAAANAAAYAADNAAYAAARAEMQKRIIANGIKILEDSK